MSQLISKAEDLYLEYFNDYLSVERFAEDYAISVEMAKCILKLGKLINNEKV